MAIDPRRHLGDIGEQLALEHLERLGYELITRNHRTRWGEIDLVVHDGRSLVFVEVKTRRASSEGRGPWEALHGPQQRQGRRMAAAHPAEVTEPPRAAHPPFHPV